MSHILLPDNMPETMLEQCVRVGITRRFFLCRASQANPTLQNTCTFADLQVKSARLIEQVVIFKA